jgi:chromosome segregation ATPase
MAKKIAEHDAVVKEAERQHQLKVQMLQNEVDMRECNINQIQKSLHTKEQDCTLLDTQLVTARDTINDLDSEMEMKAAENNRLREQLAEMEAVMSDLYRSRKGKGTLQIEIESLKSDNDYLLALLRDTCEYADCEDFDILKSAKTKALTGSRGFIQAQTANRRARCGTPDPTSQAGQQRPAKKINNDWIPTQAVRALEEIRKKYNS